MPKVQINHPAEQVPTNEVIGTRDGKPITPAGKPWIEPVLNVNWLKSAEGAGHVQLSIELSEDYLRLALDSLNGDRAGTSLLWTPVLDRHECNELIRAVRSARDGAYAADA